MKTTFNFDSERFSKKQKIEKRIALEQLVRG